jgi:hypothetical protein
MSRDPRPDYREYFSQEMWKEKEIDQTAGGGRVWMEATAGVFADAVARLSGELEVKDPG